jgi:purine-binding chemotaxis protein CheW
MSTYTIVKVAAETYAIPVGNVVEITGLGELTAVPGARAEILGVRNLRRQILPVVDLALVLGIPTTASPRLLIVAEAGKVTAGLAVDEVSDVGELPDPTEEPPSDFLLGAMLRGGDLIGVIDIPRVFGWLAEAAR